MGSGRSSGAIMTTTSASIRIRPDLTSGICRIWPRTGIRSGRDPYRTHGPYAKGPGVRAWKFRIRPDLATAFYPSFPTMTPESYLAWKEYRDIRDAFITMG
jgi:hypothetical protein